MIVPICNIGMYMYVYIYTILDPQFDLGLLSRPHCVEDNEELLLGSSSGAVTRIKVSLGAWR